MKNENGQTLVEIIAALGVMVLILSAITVAAISSLSNTTTNKNQNLATADAQQGMEGIRNLRTSDYATFSSLSGNYCLAKACDTLDSTKPTCWTAGSGCGTNVDGIFSRTVTAPASSPDCAVSTKEIQVFVSWSDGKCSGGAFCHQVKVVSCFSSNTAVQAP